MKFCTKCGSELVDEAVICVHCGCEVAPRSMAAQVSTAKEKSTLDTVISVFLILGAVVTSLFGLVIPLAWCLPMTLSYFKKRENNLPISTGFKVCTLIFVSLVAGILLLCRKEDRQ